MHKWKLHTTPFCESEYESQTISHIVTKCPIRAFNGIPKDIHSINKDVVEWIQNLDIDL